MDGATFDALVKRLTQTRLSRVEALRGVLATAMVGLAGVARADDTAAKRRRKRKGAAKKQGKGHHKHHHNHHHKHHGGGGGGGGTPTPPPPPPPLSPPSPPAPPAPPATTTTGAPPSLPSPPPSPPPLGEPPPCTPEGRACQQHSECCGGTCFGQVCAAKPSTCPVNGSPQPCSSTATGCCAGEGCCQPPANQCNITGGQPGLCCAPNCANRECGPDGCGNTGTCGRCLPGQTCTANGRCQGQPTCSPATCATGCCDASGTCQPGNTTGACGDGGGACQNCSAQGQVCGGGGTPGVCGCASDAATCAGKCGFVQNNCGQEINCTALCAGCCDNNFVCQPGTAQFACGTGGETCIECIFGEEGRCVNGKCECDATFCPDGCCANAGPGTPGFCKAGDTDQACGADGAQCVACPSGTTCCNHVCQRELRGNGAACAQGSQCCSGNCFNDRCADRPQFCGGTQCLGNDNTGCAGDTCCTEAAVRSCGVAGQLQTCCDHPCCGETCCPQDKQHVCCGGTRCCSNPFLTCCTDGTCCDHDCCGGTCCPPQRGCCGGNCCCGPGIGGLCCGENNDICCVTCDDLGPPYICCPDTIECGKPAGSSCQFPGSFDNECCSTQCDNNGRCT